VCGVGKGGGQGEHQPVQPAVHHVHWGRCSAVQCSEVKCSALIWRGDGAELGDENVLRGAGDRGPEVQAGARQPAGGRGAEGGQERNRVLHCTARHCTALYTAMYCTGHCIACGAPSGIGEGEGEGPPAARCW
jgi:hypothetical protein